MEFSAWLLAFFNLGQDKTREDPSGFEGMSKNSFGNITKQITNVRKNLKDAESKAVQGSRGPTGFDSNSEEGATNTAGARRKIMATEG